MALQNDFFLQAADKMGEARGKGWFVRERESVERLSSNFPLLDRAPPEQTDVPGPRQNPTFYPVRLSQNRGRKTKDPFQSEMDGRREGRKIAFEWEGHARG